MNEPFVVDDEIEVRRGDGVCLTGWETVIFELDDDFPRHPEPAERGEGSPDATVFAFGDPSLRSG
jgi:hypothetical protein